METRNLVGNKIEKVEKLVKKAEKMIEIKKIKKKIHGMPSKHR